jgi:ABC-type transporter Mla subunit MlaD
MSFQKDYDVERDMEYLNDLLDEVDQDLDELEKFFKDSELFHTHYDKQR